MYAYVQRVGDILKYISYIVLASYCSQKGAKYSSFSI